MPRTLLSQLDRIATAAGNKILDIYHGEFDVDIKSDGSPVTIADRLADDLIREELTKLDSSIPILSEEKEQTQHEVRKTWTEYWLVDPLDGTRSFTERKGQFTVNIALIRNTMPVLGTVRAPLGEVSYNGDSERREANRLAGDQESALRTRSINTELLSVLASKSHRTPKDETYLQKLRQRYQDMQFVSDSSSLKFCVIAEGNADVYPRFQHTFEWDIGAAHAVLLAAGGDIFHLSGDPFRYNIKDCLLNDAFIAVGDTDSEWLNYLLREANQVDQM